MHGLWGLFTRVGLGNVCVHMYTTSDLSCKLNLFWSTRHCHQGRGDRKALIPFMDQPAVSKLLGLDNEKACQLNQEKANQEESRIRGTRESDKGSGLMPGYSSLCTAWPGPLCHFKGSDSGSSDTRRTIQLDPGLPK